MAAPVFPAALQSTSTQASKLRDFAWLSITTKSTILCPADATHVSIGITKQATLKDADSGVEYGKASLVNGKIQISTLKEVLAADKLSLKLVDGWIPQVDKDGWSVRSLPEDNDVVMVTTAPKLGGDLGRTSSPGPTTAETTVPGECMLLVAAAWLGKFHTQRMGGYTCSAQRLCVWLPQSHWWQAGITIVLRPSASCSPTSAVSCHQPPYHMH